jgi:hypothetical protein
MHFPEVTIGDLLLAQFVAAVTSVVVEDQLGGMTCHVFGDYKAMPFVVDPILQGKAKVGVNHDRDSAQAESFIETDRIILCATTANAVETLVYALVESSSVFRLI